MAPVSSWTTPALATVRGNNKAYIEGRLNEPLIPNDVPRVLADANAGNAHLNLQYLDWQANQLLPDTAQKQFLDKWATIFLVNADGSRGRKAATYTSGTVTFTATVYGSDLPAGSLMTAQNGGATLTFQTTAATSIATAATPVPVRALNAGASANLEAGSTLSLAATVPGVNATAVVVSLSGGADQETDDELRPRVLARIQQPPMGGDADDYVAWAKQVAGVTRAWCAPNEMGVGTVTLRIMCDDLRATSDALTDGFPLQTDLDAVWSYIDTVRPVTVKEFFVCAPIPQPVDCAIANLIPNTTAAQASAQASFAAMIARKARPASALNGVLQPAQPISAASVSAAISAAAGVTDFDLTMADAVMANNGCMAVPGQISFG